MTSGNNGRNPPSHIVQLIGIRPNSVQCKYDRVGQVWVNELYTEVNQRGNLYASTPVPRSCSEYPYDASTLKGWVAPMTPSNLKVPVSKPAQEVERASVFMMQEACQAGAPAGGSDGSWIQAQSADLSGMTFSG
eukprot:9271915-Pyramimonas_sp.AAC.1